MTRFKLDRSYYIPKDAEVMAEQGDAIVYGYATPKPCAVAFKGKAQKPAWHYSYMSEEARQAKVTEWFRGLCLSEELKTRCKSNRQEAILEANIKPGDYFYTSWGYDQTNIDYLVVVKASSTGKTIQCRMASPIYLGESGHQDVLMPSTAYGDVFTMRVSGKDSLVGSYPYCQGSKRLGSFSKTSIAHTHRQTMAEFGH